MKRIVVLSLMVLTILPKISGASFTLSHYCEKAYTNAISLKVDSAYYYLNKEKLANSDNLLPILIENYIDFLKIYTSQSETLYDNLKPSFNQRAKALKQANGNSAYYLHSIGEVYLHSAVLHIQFGEYVKGLFDIRKAYKHFEDNLNQYPNFALSKKSMGMLLTILGSVPEQYQSALKLIGLTGNVDEGMSMLKTALNLSKANNSVFSHEIATVMAFLQLHIQNKPEAAWNTLISNQFNPTENKMDAFSLGHIGIHGTHNQAGINALKQAPSTKDYLNFPYLNFLIGLGLTYQLNSSANQYFESFLKQTKGKNYIKSAYHKMAWNALINQNETTYFNYLNNIPLKGQNILDTDKQATNEYEKQKAPNVILLKARLLCDGNLLKQAKSLLDHHHVNDFKTTSEKTEFYYRLARIYDKQNDRFNAKRYYEITINTGKSINTYFAANAAYLLGFIYENEADYNEASKYYNICFTLKGHEYENSINQKAKAGLNRIGHVKH